VETLGKRGGYTGVLGDARNTHDLGDNPHIGGSETRRQILQELRVALMDEPAAMGGPAGSRDELLGRIRGIASVRVGHTVMLLNRLGFTQSDHLYLMRDNLAAGRPIKPEDVQWLDTVTAIEAADRA